MLKSPLFELHIALLLYPLDFSLLESEEAVTWFLTVVEVEVVSLAFLEVEEVCPMDLGEVGELHFNHHPMILVHLQCSSWNL